MGDTVCGSGNRDARILLGRPARRFSRRLPQAGPVGAASVFQPEAPAGGTRWLQRRRFGGTPTPHSRQCRPIPLSKSQLPTPPQKRSDGEGPGERPTKWRQAANKIPPRSKAARIPLPKSEAMGRGQGRGDKKGGNPPIQNLRAKARIRGGILITRGCRLGLPTVGPFWANKKTTRKAMPTNSPPQKRSDGEGPGERPQKWRQAANKNPYQKRIPPTSLIFEPSQDPKSPMSSCPA